jgi:hypothetical protein
MKFARNPSPPPTRMHIPSPKNVPEIPETQNRFRCPSWIHVSVSRKCQLAPPFQRHQVQPETELLVAGHRPRHDIATGIGDNPHASVSNILQERRLIQKFQDEISVISAQVPQK